MPDATKCCSDQEQKEQAVLIRDGAVVCPYCSHKCSVLVKESSAETSEFCKHLDCVISARNKNYAMFKKD